MKYAFGGHLLRGNPRIARHLSNKRPIHLVLKSSKADGAHRLILQERFFANVARKLGRKHGIKIYSLRVEAQHVHMILKIQSRRAYQRFIRAFSGMVVRILFGIKRGPALRSSNTDSRKTRRFWDARPFTAIANWGPQFDRLKSYLNQSAIEAIGFYVVQTKVLQSYPEAINRWKVDNPLPGTEFALIAPK